MSIHHIICASMILILSACTSHDTTLTKRDLGTLIGAAGGAIASTNIGKGKGNVAAIAIGTLVGAAIGGEIGNSLDKADRLMLTNNNQYALETLPTGQTSHWDNPDSGNGGSITLTKTYQQQNQYCREFTQTISLHGKDEQGYGTACRQEDGSWQLQ